MRKENFAVYGIQMSIPDDWRVEMNPKDTRAKGDIAFHTPKGNRFFVSWGRLDDAKSRFPTLKEHRDGQVKRLKSGQVSKVSIKESRDDIINGHEALFSKVTAETSEGMFSRRSSERNMWSVHFYCPEKSRYYTVYCLLRDPAEYESVDSVFNDLVRSTTCH
ncbi:MAG TPA: hypothetical protein VJN71_11150 [Nitrososphaerales archaeon]|nr:hypothetical protein [Nitrososphaerales archaeon]